MKLLPPLPRLKQFFLLTLFLSFVAVELSFALQWHHEKKREDLAYGRFGSALVDPASSFSAQPVLASEDDTVIDFLLLGSHGIHTDTILLAMVNTEDESIHLLSIPRDFYYNQRRINQLYGYEGLDSLSEAIFAITGRTVDHFVSIDMQGFANGINALGGVDIYVPESISDYTYPGPNGTYEPYSIEKGAYHMDGDEALKYARSRHGSSDFSRAERQQRILNAARAQVLTLLGNGELTPLISMIESLAKDLKTDMNVLSLADFALRFKGYDLRRGLVLSTSNYLYSQTNENGAYMLLPNNGNYDEIQEAVASELQ